MSQENQEVVQEEVTETVAKADYDSLVAELEEVKGKLPVEKSESEVANEAKAQELFQKEISLTLRENGLEAFTDVISVKDSTDLSTKIDTLNKIVNEIKVNMGYVPADNTKQDEYSIAESKKDTKAMISTKLANLFK
ncbi:hypothetical protein [Domibacillus epiphyticus]|uniref:DUF4355 domain-containing protein n=1 Tax=Domibacillus epiphyticus TaxID=1714355 RepID=A0A1V2A7D8_9BACI|nr:hypothetical protein [Domibacillus epiphyticus]OMP66876.1 hypothetical protein BTO28_09695 [Domibacillus epiphyticus]